MTKHRYALDPEGTPMMTRCDNTPIDAVLSLHARMVDAGVDRFDLKWSLLVAEDRRDSIPMFAGKYELPVSFCPWCGEKLPDKSEPFVGQDSWRPG